MTLVAKVPETVKIEYIVNHYIKIHTDDSLPKNLKVLIDARGTQFKLNVEDLNHARKELVQALGKYTSIREAILVDKPHATAIAILFSDSYSDITSYSFRVFSTEIEALRWLQNIR